MAIFILFLFLGFHSKHCLIYDCDCFKHRTVRITFYCRQLPDQIWVQCDNPECLKWRKLPDGTDPQKLPDKWYCKENPNPRMRSCSIPEEKEEEVEQPYVKTQKKRLWVTIVTIFFPLPLCNTLFLRSEFHIFLHKLKGAAGLCILKTSLVLKLSSLSSVPVIHINHLHPLPFLFRFGLFLFQLVFFYLSKWLFSGFLQNMSK